jgi:hypothetical protein
MKIIVVVSLYKRYDNMRRWIHSWNLSDTSNAELFIVNNVDPEMETSRLKKYCNEKGVHYISRENVGFESGVLQDVIVGNMFKEQNWDIFLFATDDTLPIKKDWLKQYVNLLTNPDVGVACMEISGVWTPHIRTTGWAIRKDVANNLYFVHYPIQTKEQCYFFEHQGYEDTLMSQVLKMDKRVVQLSNIKESVMWDTHHHADHNRWDEWNREFPKFK